MVVITVPCGPEGTIIYKESVSHIILSPGGLSTAVVRIREAHTAIVWA